MTNRTGDGDELSIPCTESLSRWVGGSCLDLVYEFNDRYLESLACGMRRDRPEAMPAVVRRDRSLWDAMDEKARRRASMCPFLLADFHFSNVRWWQKALSGERSYEPFPRASDFPWVIAMDLARDALTVAWYTARQDICLATLLIGAPAEVAEIMSKFTLHALWRLADQSHYELHPRYENRRAFWSRLLSAATRGDQEALHDLHRSAFLFADSERECRAPARSRRPVSRDS